MDIKSVNQKELNYCLRHHTKTTLALFGLHGIRTRLELTPEQSLWEIHEAWAGHQPKYIDLPLSSWIGVQYMKDYPDD